MRLISKTNLPVLNDVGARGVISIAAGVVVCVPLAAPRTGHARHAPKSHTQIQSPDAKVKIFHT